MAYAYDTPPGESLHHNHKWTSKTLHYRSCMAILRCPRDYALWNRPQRNTHDIRNYLLTGRCHTEMSRRDYGFVAYTTLTGNFIGLPSNKKRRNSLSNSILKNFLSQNSTHLNNHTRLLTPGLSRFKRALKIFFLLHMMTKNVKLV